MHFTIKELFALYVYTSEKLTHVHTEIAMGMTRACWNSEELKTLKCPPVEDISRTVTGPDTALEQCVSMWAMLAHDFGWKKGEMRCAIYNTIL